MNTLITKGCGGARRRVWGPVAAVLFCAVQTWAPGAAAPKPRAAPAPPVEDADGATTTGATHALLINGGSNPEINYLSHLHHLQDMVAVLGERGVPSGRIHIFSGDGEDPAPDLAARDSLPPQFWLLAGTVLGRRLRPRTEVINTHWEGRPLKPASRAALKEWFETEGRTLVPRDRLLLFVTDHGAGNADDPDNGSIALWQDALSVHDLKDLLALLPRGVVTVMVMSQCYSGSFASAMYDSPAAGPAGSVCGFFSTARDLPAYGCYPEGRDRDRIGHAFHFIDALRRHPAAGDAHLEVLLSDGTPDVPLRTSDAYLENLVTDAARARGVTVDDLVDASLAQAWRDRAAWEPEIRLLDRLGEAYGTFSPRSLAEIEGLSREIPDLSVRMKTYAERWRGAFLGVKVENLRSFVRERPEWEERLGDPSINKLDADGRKALVLELLPQVEAHARDHPERWRRLDTLRERTERASESRWRLEVRRGVLRRMRTILVGIAGRVLLDGEAQAAEQPAAPESQVSPSRRQALVRLQGCEALAPGVLPAAPPAARASADQPYPPLSDERRLLEEVLPSWLGVRFGPVPKALRAGRDLPEGASSLLAVYPDSPATDAGLEAGDIVLGQPDHPFRFEGELREWTMTAPRGTPLRVVVLRPGEQPGDDRNFEAVLSLRPYPMALPELPGPPQVGEAAPPLPEGLAPVGRRRLRHFDGRAHLLFFWATWCLPCKAAVPEVLAFAEARGVPVLAITDEEPSLVSGFLEERHEAFFKQVASDPRRLSFMSYGISGTPTILLVDDDGVVRHRQVGYNRERGLTVEGWTWPDGRPRRPVPAGAPSGGPDQGH